MFKVSLDRPRSAVTVFLVFFTLLVLLNGPHLMDPPYWDAILGVFSQGTWLSRHAFQYRELLRLPAFSEGGPRFHLLNGVSLFVAGLQCFLRPPSVFLTLHLIALGLAALCAMVFFQILRTYVPAALALLWVLAAITNPIWSGQAISLYLEIPMTAMLSVSIYLFWKKQYVWAAVFCGIGYFVKSASLLQAIAYAAFACGVAGVEVAPVSPVPKRLDGSCLGDPGSDHAGAESWGACGGSSWAVSVETESLFCIVRTFYLAPRLYPTLALEGMVLAGWAAVAAWRRISHQPVGDSPVPDQRFWLFLSLFIVAFWSAFMITFSALVRYTVMVQLPMACLLAILLSRNLKGSLGLAGLVLVLNLLNQHGGLMGPAPRFFGRTGGWLERSREYLADLEANRRLCRFLEDKAAGQPIVTYWPYAHMLRIPEMGYVRVAVPNVMETSTPSLLAGSLPWNEAAARRYGKTLCIYAPSDLENEGKSLRPRQGDLILWVDRSLPAPLVIYERQWTAADFRENPA